MANAQHRRAVDVAQRAIDSKHGEAMDGGPGEMLGAGATGGGKDAGGDQGIERCAEELERIEAAIAGFARVAGADAVVGDRAAARMFAALSAGGQVQMPMGKTFFAPAFGMVTDKFGVMWMVLTEA